MLAWTINEAISACTCRQKAVLAGPKFVCSDGVVSHTGFPLGYLCAIPVAMLSSPFCNSILNAAVASMP